RAQREPDRMAGEGGRPAAPARRRNRPGIKWRRAQRELASTLRSRSAGAGAPADAQRFRASTLMKLLLLAALVVLAAPAFAGERVIASRVWPAEEYTRVTIET